MRTFDLGRVDVHKRTRLPHWDLEHGIIFVTFGLFDAIPKEVRTRLREEAEAQLANIRALRGEPTIAEKRAVEQWVHAKLGESLDDSYGSCFMREPRVASCVAEALTHFDETRYSLFTWCVMPNHVHAVLALTAAERIDRVMHSWKSYTSKACNRPLGRQGQFWQEDYFDHSVRSQEEFRDTVEYVLNNPVKAGLSDWPYVRSYPERIAAV